MVTEVGGVAECGQNERDYGKSTSKA